VPEQDKENVVPEGRGSLVKEPLVGWEPLQPPEAAQEVALIDCHCKETDLPRTTECALAVSVSLGAAREEAVVEFVLPDCDIESS
jgi:hypothetical protein